MRLRFLSEQVYESGGVYLGVAHGPIFPAGHVLDEQDVSAALRMPDPMPSENRVICDAL